MQFSLPRFFIIRIRHADRSAIKVPSTKMTLIYINSIKIHSWDILSNIYSATIPLPLLYSMPIWYTNNICKVIFEIFEILSIYGTFSIFLILADSRYLYRLENSTKINKSSQKLKYRYCIRQYEGYINNCAVNLCHLHCLHCAILSNRLHVIWYVPDRRIKLRTVHRLYSVSTGTL